jgi:arylsulfatase A-like enzyme
MIDHDKNAGAVLKALDDLGIADNTFVMYATDNGPHMNSGEYHRCVRAKISRQMAISAEFA